MWILQSDSCKPGLQHTAGDSPLPETIKIWFMRHSGQMASGFSVQWSLQNKTGKLQGPNSAKTKKLLHCPHWHLPSHHTRAQIHQPSRHLLSPLTLPLDTQISSISQPFLGLPCVPLLTRAGKGVQESSSNRQCLAALRSVHGAALAHGEGLMLRA